jgi:hypothetical protein
VVKSFHFFVMAGGNEAQRSDRMELPKHSDMNAMFFGRSKRSLRFVPACHATEQIPSV